MWRLDSDIGHLETDSLTFDIDLNHIDRGIRGLEVSVNHSVVPVDCQLLQIQQSLAPLQEKYLRGRDLVALYGTSGEKPVSYQVYWRCLGNMFEGASCLELIIAAQTPRLDSLPSLQIKSEFPAGTLSAGDGIVEAVDAKANLRYFELVHPSNYDSMNIRENPIRPGVLHTFFPGRLEKGVIRQARMRAYFMDCKRSPPSINELYDNFLESESPLTT